jgi:voltage-gated potassium channel
VTGFRQLRGPLLMLLLSLALGTGGYMVLEGWSFLEALFMTVITLTTVGYEEVHPLSPAGQIFTIVLIVVGVGAALYTLTALIGWILSANWPEQRRRRQMEQRLSQLRDHFIVCGYGRVGTRVVEVFRREGIAVVIIDVNQASLADAEAADWLTVHGDAASDAVLQRAGIARARGLLVVTDSDADNVYVVLSARTLRPDLLVVARANSEDAVQKLQRAGATHVLSPYELAGRRLALLGLRPAAVEFVETVLHTGREQLMLEEVRVTPGSRMAGMCLGTVRREALGPAIVALRQGGQLVTQPSDEQRLQPGDVLVLLGRPDQLHRIEELS